MASVLVKLCAFGSVPWRMARTSLATHPRIHYDAVRCFSMKVKPSAPPWSSGGKRIERVYSRNSYESPLPHEPRHHRKVVDGEEEDEVEHFSPREDKRMQRSGKGSFRVDRGNASELKYLRDEDYVKKPWSSGGKRTERVSSRNSYESPLPHEPRHHPKVVDGEEEDEEEHFSPRENKRMQRPGKGSFQVDRGYASELRYLRDEDSVKKPWSSGGKRTERVSSRNSYESRLPHESRHHPKVVDGEEEDEEEHFLPRENKRMQRPGKGSFQVDRGNTSELKYLRDDDPVKKSYRPQKPAPFELSEGSEILFGVAPCHLALSQSRRNFLNLFLKSTLKPQRPEIQEMFEQAEARGVPVHHVKRHILDSLCKDRVHQGVCMEVTPLRYERLDGEQQGVAESELVGPEKQVLWLVLEGMQDPMNVGAILRTAYFLGVTRVLSSLTNSCALTPTVSKASAGTMELLEVFGVDNLPEVLQEKIEQGWQVLGTVGKTEALEGVPVITTSEFQWSRPTILVLGNEGHGISSEMRSLCQMMLTIPPGRVLHPGIESLNVSVAAGIMLHGLYGRRTC
ncbi:rRNA methyltransferase 1, mitochondrial [Lissotriton helveticus]